MKSIGWFVVFAASLLLTSPAKAQSTDSAPNPEPMSVLFHNVRLFDGVQDKLSGPADLLVQGNTIAKISTTAITPEPDTKVIDGTGRTLMPGLIDAHAHIMLAAMPMQAAPR